MTECCGIEIASWYEFFAYFQWHLEKVWIEDPA